MPYDRNKRAGGNRGSKFGGRTGGRDFGDSKPSVMYPAICNECDRECEVPFKPSGEKPVFCRNCFKRDESGPRDSFGGGNSFGKRSYGGKPSSFGGKSNGFGGKPSGGGMTKEQFDILNSKLDQIIEALAVD